MNTYNSYLSKDEQKEKKLYYDKTYSKKYREKNEEAIKEYQKLYYENKQRQILDRMKVKLFCECGCEINKSSTKRHERKKIILI
jgi:hypothetical protein